MAADGLACTSVAVRVLQANETARLATGDHSAGAAMRYCRRLIKSIVWIVTIRVSNLEESSRRGGLWSLLKRAGLIHR